MTDLELAVYERNLIKLTALLDKFFAHQKEYISCKDGCSVCCQNSYYPCSELEYKYLKSCFDSLSPETMELVQQRVIDILAERKEFLKTNPNIMEFSYKCPFLINDSCSVYSHRPLMCRGYGLLHHEFNEPDTCFVPYCTHLGLNYSKVYNPQTKKLDYSKVDQSQNMPKVFNTSYTALISMFNGLDFGDVRMLYEFVILDRSDSEALIKG